MEQSLDTSVYTNVNLGEKMVLVMTTGLKFSYCNTEYLSQSAHK